jgi:Flp pilus assembly protein TadG
VTRLSGPRLLSARHEGGTVTAEAAIVLPLIAAFCMALVWMVSLGISQILTVDAARDAARAVARGDDQATAAQAAGRTAPDGAVVSFTQSAGTVTATVSVRAAAPGWLLVPMPAVTLTSSSTVEVESDAQ